MSEKRSFLEFFWIWVILEKLARKMYFTCRQLHTSTPAQHQLRERPHMPAHIFWLYYLSKLSMFTLENRFLWRGAPGRTPKKVVEIWKISRIAKISVTSLHSRNQLRGLTAGLENSAWGAINRLFLVKRPCQTMYTFMSFQWKLSIFMKFQHVPFRIS